MTLTDLMPIRIGLPARRTRHRAIDEVERQRFLRSAADLYIKGLHLQLGDMERKHAETVARLDERYTATIRQLEAELADVNRRLAIACKAETAVTRTQEIPVEEIRRHCTPMPLHEARDAGLLGPVTNPGHMPTA